MWGIFCLMRITNAFSMVHMRFHSQTKKSCVEGVNQGAVRWPRFGRTWAEDEFYGFVVDASDWREWRRFNKKNRSGFLHCVDRSHDMLTLLRDVSMAPMDGYVHLHVCTYTTL